MCIERIKAKKCHKQKKHITKVTHRLDQELSKKLTLKQQIKLPAKSIFVFYITLETYFKQVLLICSKVYLLVVCMQNLGPEVIEGEDDGLLTVLKTHLPLVLT